MTKSTSTTRPVVKSMKPELYVQHTFHMKRAHRYTYNYAVVDDYILANWLTSTIKAMATELNEYPYRIEYRIQVLRGAGLIDNKRTRRSPKLLERRRLLVTWLKEIDAKLKGVV